MKKGISIYTLEDKLLDKIINKYSDYVSNPKNVHRQDFSNINMYTGEVIYNDGKGIIDMPLSTHTNIIGETIIDRENLPKPQYINTRNNFLFLLDNIYRHYINTEPDVNDEVWFLLSSEMLKKIDEYYNYKIEVLFILGVLNRRQFDEKRCEYTLSNPNIFRSTKCQLGDVIEKKERFQNAFEKWHKERIIEIHEEAILPFVDKYNKSVKHLKLIDVDGARMCADSQTKERARLYYHNFITKIEERQINNVVIDSNGRWYHLGTALPKNLKPYTNIQYSIDCKNSHPLLFNILILDYFLNNDSISINNKYNIDKLYSIYYLINYYIFDYYNLFSFHYFGGNLCNYLKTNNVEDDIIAKVKKIPYDVYTYMYHTMKGNFWEYFLEYFKDDHDLMRYEEKDRRGEIKKILFAKVFYGGQTKIYQNDKNKQWAEAFRDKYPNVWRIIVWYKQTLHEETIGTKEEGKKVLSWLLMRVESRIFTNILQKLFNKRGLVVISIHDAIVVLKDNNIGEEKIKEIMIEEYAKYGLIPTLSVDRYY